MADAVTPAEAARLVAHGKHEQPETQILRQVSDYLRTAGWYVIREQQGPLSHKGMSDLVCIRRGRVVFVEVKTATGRLSDWQQGFRQVIANEGGEYHVVRCLEDAIAMSGEAWPA